MQMDTGLGSAEFSPREASGTMVALKGLDMEKWLCWGSMGIAGLIVLLFTLDLLLGTPFGRVSAMVDLLAILAGGIVLFLAYDASKDLR